jgi:hypothetical protein
VKLERFPPVAAGAEAVSVFSAFIKSAKYLWTISNSWDFPSTE